MRTNVGAAIATAIAFLSGSASLTHAAEEHSAATSSAACPHDLDYLIGEWIANPAAPNTDVKWEAPAGSCYLIETWSPRDSKSSPYYALLAYDSKLKNWSYLAASPRGQRLRFEDGIVKGDKITLQQADTAKGAIHRFSYTKLGQDSVQETQLRSSDGGKTWKTDYDLTWKRKK